MQVAHTCFCSDDGRNWNSFPLVLPMATSVEATGLLSLSGSCRATVGGHVSVIVLQLIRDSLSTGCLALASFKHPLLRYRVLRVLLTGVGCVTSSL